MTFTIHIRNNQFRKKFQIFFEISQIDMKVSVVPHGGLVGSQDNINTYTHVPTPHPTPTHPLYSRNCFIIPWYAVKYHFISLCHWNLYVFVIHFGIILSFPFRSCYLCKSNILVQGWLILQLSLCYIRFDLITQTSMPCLISSSSPFYRHRWTLIPVWISNYIHHDVWDETTYPFPNFNGSTVEPWEWISNIIPHLKGRVIEYPCRD